MAKEYYITKTDGLCCGCEKKMEPHEEFMAIVKDGEEELERADFCLECWEKSPAEDAPDVLGVWKTKVPPPQEKKKLLIDDDLLVNFFERLEGTDQESKINFRFVLALILMRKKLLVYDGAKKDDDDREIWVMHLKGNDTKFHVVDPNMDEEKIAEVSSQIGEIMEGEM